MAKNDSNNLPDPSESPGGYYILMEGEERILPAAKSADEKQPKRNKEKQIREESVREAGPYILMEGEEKILVPLQKSTKGNRVSDPNQMHGIEPEKIGGINITFGGIESENLGDTTITFDETNEEEK